MVIGALGAALGVVPDPAGGVRREQERPAARTRGGEQVAKCLFVEDATPKRPISAAPAAAGPGLEAQVRRGERRDTLPGNEGV
jgi:hypothetical protein